ncbi:uncharacterized protein LOC144954186 [Lampetra fluviatilis]
METPNRGDAGNKSAVCAVIPPDQQLYTETFCGVCQSQLQHQLSQEHYLSKKHAQKVRNYIFNQRLGMDISAHSKGKRQREQLVAPPSAGQQEGQQQQGSSRGSSRRGSRGSSRSSRSVERASTALCAT